MSPRSTCRFHFGRKIFRAWVCLFTCTLVVVTIVILFSIVNSLKQLGMGVFIPGEDGELGTTGLTGSVSMTIMEALRVQCSAGSHFSSMILHSQLYLLVRFLCI